MRPQGHKAGSDTFKTNANPNRNHGMTASRRVLITGIGLVTPLGTTTTSTWSSLLSSRSGLGPMTHFDASSLPVQLAGEVDTSALPPSPPILPPTPRYARLVLHAASAALDDAGLSGTLDDRAGVSIGVGMSGLDDALAADAHLRAGRPRRISPFLVPRILPNTPASLVSLAHGLRGPCLAPSTACAAGMHAVIDGFHAVKRGDAPVMLVGGAEAAVNAVAVVGFSRARALSNKKSCPFDTDRDGFVIAEGAGVLVLEDADHAAARGATNAYAEIRSAAATADAHHVTAPHPDGDGAARAMELALQRAGADAVEVDYVNAHATSTPAGDDVERLAVAKVLENNAHAVVSATKGATGHLLGAAGAVEAAFTAMAVAGDVVPPTLNLHNLDRDERVERLGWGDVERFVPQKLREMRVDTALCNSFGFGGTNASVVLTKPADGFAKRAAAV